MSILNTRVHGPPHLEPAYNSLGITQKKTGELDSALHSFEEGLKALSRRIARTMRNQRDSRIFPRPGVSGTRWMQVATNGATYLCAKDADISRLAWDTGEQAIQARAKVHAGLFWKDSVDASGAKTRLFLPNFFYTFCTRLREERLYGTVLGNLGSVLDLMGKRIAAKACFSEAEEFLESAGNTHQGMARGATKWPLMSAEEVHAFGLEVILPFLKKEGVAIESVNRDPGMNSQIVGQRSGSLAFIFVRTALYPNKGELTEAQFKQCLADQGGGARRGRRAARNRAPAASSASRG